MEVAVKSPKYYRIGLNKCEGFALPHPPTVAMTKSTQIKLCSTGPRKKKSKQIMDMNLATFSEFCTD